MSDPVQRLGIGIADRRPTDVSPWLSAAHDRLAPTASEWALLTSVALTAVPMAVAVWLFFGFVPAAAVLGGHGGVLAVVARRAHRRHQQRLADGLPVALDGLARDLRTGASFRSAVARQATEPGPIAVHFRRVHTAIELGQPADEACIALVANARSIHNGQTTAGVLAMASGGGRGSARALEEAAHAARQEQVVRGEVRALVAQAESSVRVLAGLPIVFVGLGMLSGQAGAMALFHTSVGRWCLAIGIVLDGAGLVWMRALVRSVTA